MNELKRYLWFVIVLGILMIVKFEFSGQSFAKTAKVRGADLNRQEWDQVIASEVNQTQFTVRIGAREYTNLNDGIYMDGGRQFMIPTAIIRDAFACSAHLYDQKLLVIENQEDTLEFELNRNYYMKNKQKISSGKALIEKNGTFYVPLEILAEQLEYSCQWNMEEHMLMVQSISSDMRGHLPFRYDLREKGRAPQIKDQGPYGTCWAFASLTALESALLPESNIRFSVDHMNQNNSFAMPKKDGGQYTMAMAYLAAWQGPVKEADDPYGDGKTDVSLQAVRHVQDMQIIESKNLEEIKQAVFQYGGVESCIYTTLQNADGESPYYNNKTYAYCYIGEAKPNHDVVIIGWDDYFPKENFRTDVAGNGAFICQNSWGTDFGEDGVFYVSYYDANIGIHNLVFTGVEDSDNYDRLYQADLCGWVGQIGYEQESMYGANVYTAQTEEDVAAAGFYTTDSNTSYRVFLVPDFTDTASFHDRILVAEGQFENAGYHTVRFNQLIRVARNKKFAVVLWLSTPNAARPMAIEYAADELTREVDLEDGEGYISAQGSRWTDVKASSNCNLCIKAYTKNP